MENENEEEKRLKERYMVNDQQYRELRSTYEDYRLCQIKGFVENMPYLTFPEFMEKSIRIGIRLRSELDRKCLEELWKRIGYDPLMWMH